MRDYGKVYTRFWLKQNVLSWSDSAKLLGLYLLTCPHCNLLGCFRLPIGYVASDLNWDEQQVAKALNELEQDQFLIRCEESGWTLIRSFLKHNPIENPNQGKAAFRLLKDVPADFIGMASLLKSLAAFQVRLPEEFSSLFMPDGNPVRDSQRSDDSGRSNKPTVKTVDHIQFEDFWDVQMCADLLYMTTSLSCVARLPLPVLLNHPALLRGTVRHGCRSSQHTTATHETLLS